MSTRGCIARLTSKKGEPITFKGRYCHWDNYPSGTGAVLFEKWRTEFEKNTEKMLSYLIDAHKAGWSSVQNGECYCHSKGKSKKFDVDETNASGSGVEFVYAFTEEDTMVVLSSYCANGAKMIGMFGCGDPNAEWKVIGEIKLDGKEPNWEAVPIVQVAKKAKKAKK